MTNKNWQIWILVAMVIVLCGAFTWLTVAGIKKLLPEELPVQGVWQTSWESIFISITVIFFAIFMSLFPFSMVFSLYTGQHRERLKGDVWASLQRMNVRKLLLESVKFEQLTAKEKKDEKAGSVVEEEQMANSFAQRFDDYYGPLTFTLPILSFSTISFIGWMIVLFPNSITGGEPAVINNMSYYGFAAMIQGGLVAYVKDIAQAGSLFSFSFLGAYFWSVQGLIRRYLYSDLKPRYFMYATTRILSSWMVALVLTVSMPSEWAGQNQAWITPTLGFFIGIFTMRIVQALWKLLIMNIKSLFIKSDEFGKEIKLTDIPGINIFHADRLAEENIENVDDLTGADLMDLLTHLRYPANTIIDWIDKGLLVRYVQSPALYKALGEYGIQSASDLADIWHNNSNKTYLTNAELQAAFPKDKNKIKGIVTSLHRSSNFEHVYSYWEKTPDNERTHTNPHNHHLPNR